MQEYEDRVVSSLICCIGQRHFYDFIRTNPKKRTTITIFGVGLQIWMLAGLVEEFQLYLYHTWIQHIDW